MTEGWEPPRLDALLMPSWTTADPPEKLATPADSGATTAIDRARRLLEQLFAGRPRDGKPPRPKQ
jgi:hypothetical protein